MVLTESEGSRIVKADIAGSRSVIEALRCGIAEAEDEAISSARRAGALSAIRNEGLIGLKDKYEMKGNRS